jgi:hypothetical protein
MARTSLGESGGVNGTAVASGKAFLGTSCQDDDAWCP